MQKRIEIGGHHLEKMNWKCVDVRDEMCTTRMAVGEDVERVSLVRSNCKSGILVIRPVTVNLTQLATPAMGGGIRESLRYTTDRSLSS